MSYFAFFFSLLAASSLASDLREDSISSDKPISVPSLLKLSSQYCLYDVGLDMSMIKDIITTESSCYFSNNEKLDSITIKVCPEKLAGFGSLKGPGSSTTIVACPYLFNVQKLSGIGSGRISLKKFRRVMSECALTPDAAIVGDVAIVKWFVQEMEKNIDVRFSFDWSLVEPLCQISVYPIIGEECKSDIIKVLKKLSEYIESVGITDADFLYFLLNHLKFIDPEAEIQDMLLELASRQFKMLPEEESDQMMAVIYVT